MRKITMLVIGVFVVLAAFLVAVIVKPAIATSVSNVVQDQIIKPGGQALGNIYTAIVTSPFWQSYVSPYAFLYGIAVTVVGIIVWRQLTPRMWQLRRKETKKYLGGPSDEPGTVIEQQSTIEAREEQVKTAIEEETPS